MIDLKIIENLNIVSINLTPEAQRKFNSALSGAMELDKRVEVLTSYMIHKGFITTIRTGVTPL